MIPGAFPPWRQCLGNKFANQPDQSTVELAALEINGLGGSFERGVVAPVAMVSLVMVQYETLDAYSVIVNARSASL